jgi:PKD domain
MVESVLPTLTRVPWVPIDHAMAGRVGFRLRWVAGCLTAVAALLAAATPAVAGQPTGHNPQGRLLGAVDAKSSVALRPRLATLRAADAGPLTYHGGPVVHDGHVYAIFWEPPGYHFPPDYRAAVVKYFNDVAADSGKRTNVYSTSRQYFDTSGPAEYRVAFDGSFTDTNALPAAGCSYPGAPLCLTDDQLTSELGAFASSHGLPRVLTRQYFLFTPSGVGSCFDSTAQACAYQDYCAYHSWIGTSGAPLLYAYHPFVAGIGTCDAGQSPTGTSADAVLNVVSHEHNEILTDPVGNGWYDQNGDENGDRCAWSFGSPQGPSGAFYNQVIAGSNYLLQREWSNANGGCAASATNEAPWASFARIGPAVARETVYFNASSAHDPDGTIASYAWRFGDGGTGSGVTPTHTYASRGTYQVKLTVTDDEGATATRTLGVIVSPPYGKPNTNPPHKKHRKHHHRKHKKKHKRH